MSLLNLIQQGGMAMYPLILCSVVTLAVIMERLYFLWGLEKDTRSFHKNLLDPLNRRDRSQITALCQVSKAPLAPVFLRVLGGSQKTGEQLELMLSNGRNEVVAALKRYLWILGTIGATAPFIGLLGTVTGIIKSFHNMAVTGAGGFDVVAAGISEALIATAAGLVVGVLAVVGYNYFSVRVNQLSSQLREFVQEFLLIFSQPSAQD